MEPNLNHSVWGYCETPTMTANDTVNELFNRIHSCHAGSHHITYDESADEIQLSHEWTKCSCWSAYDVARNSKYVSLSEFTVKNPDERARDGETITAVITPSSAAKERQRPTRQSLVETVHEYHPFNTDTVTAGDVEFKCGDISAILSLALYYEYGLQVPIVAGAVYNPKTNEGWSHGFLQVNQEQVSTVDTRLFIDGTAKQFCDGSGFEHTLGREETIDSIEVLTPYDDRFKHYALDRNQVTI